MRNSVYQHAAIVAAAVRCVYVTNLGSQAGADFLAGGGCYIMDGNVRPVMLALAADL